MGVPLLVALLGQASAGPVIMTVALDMIVTTSLCIALSRLGLGEGSAGRALRLALKGVLVSPPALGDWLGGPGLGHAGFNYPGL